ncbi:uncharacterized protein LOC132757193 [Ruditapes philippinarum]|uniref:uncharacterized protein LOC132757193 n=1 Tax=Ruditapes philippinarum TaxID=129788 RepID=UPI00295BC2D8|nr:uncharacterized protein LOC132757193 [Ruditapes philippinarum]
MLLKVNKRQYTCKMEGNLAIDNQRVAKSTFKDILISPNNDHIIIPISATFDKAVLHIGIGNGSCGIFIEKFGLKNGKELGTSVKHATRKFTNARNQRKNKGKDTKASKNEDIKTVVDESGENFTRDFPSMTEIERQLAKLIDHFVVKAPKKIKNIKDRISDTKPLKESKSVNIECDIAATDESVQSTKGTVFTSNIKSDLRRKPRHDKEIAEITTHSFDHQNLIEPNMNIHLYKRNEKSLKATKITSFEAIDKAYENEMLGIAMDKEAGVYKPNCIRPIGFPLADDMHVYLNEVFVISKRCSQMFDEIVSATKEKRRNDEQLEDISGSGPTGLVIDINKDNTVADINLFGDVLDKDQCCPISSDTIVDRAADNDSDTLDRINPYTSESDDSTIIDRGAVGEMLYSDTLDMLDIESDEDIVDIEAIALQEQDEVDILSPRNDTADNSTNDNGMVDDDHKLFGVMGIYINSDLHFDLHNMPDSAEHCDQKKDLGYKFFSFSTFFK